MNLVLKIKQNKKLFYRKMFRNIPNVRRQTQGRINDLIRVYFGQVLHPTPSHVRNNRLFVAALFLYAIDPLILTVTRGLTDFQRVLLHDPLLFYQMPQKYCSNLLLFALNAINFHYQIFNRPSKKLTRLLNEVRYGEEGAAVHFFVSQRMCGETKANMNEMVLVTRLINSHTNRKYYIPEYFAYTGAEVTLFFHLNSLGYILKFARHFFCSFCGLACLCLVALCSAAFDVMMFSFSRAIMLWTMTVVMSTRIFFLKFTQVNRLLHSSGLNNRFTLVALNRFTRHHTRTLSLLFEFNRFFGSSLLVFIILNFPQNTYLLMAITMGQFDTFAALIFLNYVLCQYVFIVWFHLLAAMYSERIHRCRKRLFYLSSNKRLHHLTLRGRLRLALYILKFSTCKRYGITYGPYGLMSFKSFAKFGLMYAEFLMYCFRFIRKI